MSLTGIHINARFPSIRADLLRTSLTFCPPAWSSVGHSLTFFAATHLPPSLSLTRHLYKRPPSLTTHTAHLPPSQLRTIPTQQHSHSHSIPYSAPTHHNHNAPPPPSPHPPLHPHLRHPTRSRRHRPGVPRRGRTRCKRQALRLLQHPGGRVRGRAIHSASHHDTTGKGHTRADGTHQNPCTDADQAEHFQTVDNKWCTLCLMFSVCHALFLLPVCDG
jgi:hypothetical protein